MRSPEPESYKDKIELSLDGRQVFYLFFGGAVIACLVFVLGVMVGRRVEARAHVDRAGTSAARDPLAALDQLDDAGREELQFRRALSGGEVNTEVDQAIASIERTRRRSAAASEPPADQEDPAPEPAAAAKKPAKPADKKPDKAPARAAAPEAVKPHPGRFTLQLSSFKARDEAEAFVTSVRDAGYKAYVIEADVEGKGTFFRVRFGEYESYQAAIDAKAEFEDKVQKIAYVTRL